MNIVRLAALTDPVTPAPALATIAAGDEDDLVGAYLLAHPNTPPHLAADHTIISAYQARPALTSPTLTDTTRTRVMAAISDDALRELLTGEFRGFDPRHVTELGDRLARQGDPANAKILLDHPWATSDTQVTALHITAALLPTLDTPIERHRFRLAATHHPEHLRTLAATATRRAAADAPRISQALTSSADQHDAGLDPTSQLLNDIRTQVHRGDLAASSAILHYPDPQLALELYTAHHDDWLLLENIRKSTALTGSHAWRLANLRFTCLEPPDPSLALPVDIMTAAAMHSTWVTFRLGYTSMTPTRDAAVLDAAAAAVPALVANAPQDSHSELARHIARLLIHPRTPTTHLDTLRASAHEMVKLVGAQHSIQFGLQLALDLTCSGQDQMTTTAAAMTLARLTEADGMDRDAFQILLAHWVAPALQPLWDDPDTTRAGLALAGTFPGTLTDLVQVARTVMA